MVDRELQDELRALLAEPDAAERASVGRRDKRRRNSRAEKLRAEANLGGDARAAAELDQVRRAASARRSENEMLADALRELREDPLGYVMFNFPWDTDPSIQLIALPRAYRDRFPGQEHGPDLWQCEFLDELGREIRQRAFDGSTPVRPIRFATRSGHEIGKSCLVAWLVKFILDCWPYSKISLSAVTDEQLRTKTWAEVGKWHRLSLTEHWYDYNSARGSMTLVSKWDDTHRADARTSRPEKSEAFAGQHAPKGVSSYIFDEASGIYDKVYEVREGGTSSGMPMMFDFGNPTKNSGKFHEECEGKLQRLGWIIRSIDSRDVAITNKEKITEDVETYGEDSDFVRVRWRGLPPKAGQSQFMPSDLVEAAMTREMIGEVRGPMVLGVDCARFGPDDSVIYPRCGRDARSWSPKVFSGYDTKQLTDAVVREVKMFEGLGLPVQMIFVDETGGYGAGVIDNLRYGGYPVMGVQFGSTRHGRPREFRFVSDFLWGNLRDALPSLYLPSRDSELGRRLYDELTQREYGFIKGETVVHLETKAAMKARGLYSPDLTDGLALTYYMEIDSISDHVRRAFEEEWDEDYDPFAEGRAG